MILVINCDAKSNLGKEYIDGDQHDTSQNGVLLKEEGRTGFSKGWQGSSEGFPEGGAQGKSRGAALPAQGKPVLSDYFTQIYIQFLIGFRIGPPKIHKRIRIGLPKIHRRFRIGPPKMHRQFRIGPLQVSLNLLPPEFHGRGILLTSAIIIICLFSCMVNTARYNKPHGAAKNTQHWMKKLQYQKN